ncbi:MAG TPA: hypothetical protein VHZ76_04630 [Gammaproteobacteria bacterium]|jgi:hypothetical protein|nr:hypothetical protein [Gammaproteobacteria bacterium]
MATFTAIVVNRYKYNYEIQVTIPASESESCSFGTYQLTIKKPDEKKEHFTKERDGSIVKVWFEFLIL